jgi:hypothetical protein
MPRFRAMSHCLGAFVQPLCNQNFNDHADVRPSRALTMERLADLRQRANPRIWNAPGTGRYRGRYFLPGNLRNAGVDRGRRVVWIGPFVADVAFDQRFRPIAFCLRQQERGPGGGRGSHSKLRLLVHALKENCLHKSD